MGFTSQIQKLKEEELQLIEKKKKIFESRKNEIGRLAEKIQVLELSDSVIAGAFLALKNADKNLIAGYEESGKRFLKPREKSQKNKKDNPGNKSE